MSTFNAQVNSTANECSTESNGSFYPAPYSVALIGNNAGRSCNAYFRFPSVTIPNGAIVSSATLEVKSFNSTSNQLNSQIGCSNEDNAATPTSYSDANSRSFTATPATWNVSTAWTGGSWYFSADFAASAQELFARAGWASGNALLVMIRHTSAGDLRQIDRYGYDPTYAPKLAITYTVGAAGQPTTVRFNGTPGAKLGGQTFGRGW
jgi:hypothetical protein